jgi:small subunit ribosomal protein S17
MYQHRRQMEGRVVSDKMDKTVVVEVTHVRRHPLYGRVVRSHARFKAHDEENACKVGDVVRIRECRPISKEKSWRVEQVVGRVEEFQAPDSAVAEVLPEE